MEQNRINLYQGLKSDGNYTKSYSEFQTQYFSDKNGVEKLWNLLIGDSTYTKPIKDFYTKYACDLEWAKSTSYCGGSQSAQPDQGGGTQTPPPSPSPDQGGGSSSGSGSFGRDVSFTADDVANGKNIGYGMRGDIVGKIQERLIKHGFTNISKDGKVDKLYGSRTRNAVKEFQKTHKDKDGVQLKDDGVVGPKTWWALLQEPASSGTTTTTTKAPSQTTTTTTLPPTQTGVNVNTPSKEEVKKQGGGPSRGTATIETL